MSLSLPTTLYIYYHGNYLGNLYWIWRRHEKINDHTKTLEAQAILKVYNEIPKYSTRQMRKNVTSKVIYYRIANLIYNYQTNINLFIVFTFYKAFSISYSCNISRYHW